jgi:hypothetical protein
MSSATQAVPVSQKNPWPGRILTAVPALFLLADGVGKLVNPAPVVEGMARLGYPSNLTATIGIILFVCTVIYLIPRYSILGAILLTGYLGGAVASQLRIGEPLFSHVLFPTYVAAMLWGGLYLRDDRLRALVPLRTGKAA